MTTIIGIQIPERNTDSIKLQEILTHFGCNIRTRIGLHYGTEEKCSNSGIVLLDISGEYSTIVDTLRKHWITKIMEF